MRTFIISLSLVLTSLVTVAQTPRNEEDGFLLDSVIVRFKWLYNPEVVAREHYFYNLYNQLKLKKIYKNKNSFPDPADWYCTNRENLSYDDQHRLASDIFEIRDFDETDWTYDEKYEYEYNSIIHSKTSAFWDLTINNWVNGMKEIDSIKPPEDLEESFLRQFWNRETNNWENEVWFDTLYLENGLIDSIVYTHYAPDSSIHISYDLYDYSYYPDTLFIYEYGAGSPGLYFHKIYFTNDSIKKFDYHSRLNDDGSYDNLRRTICTYNENHWLIQKTKELWSNNYQQWFMDYKDSTIYNDRGLVIQFDVCDLDHKRTKYWYNDENLVERKKYYYSLPDTNLFRQWDYFYTYTYVKVPEKVSGTGNQILVYPNPAANEIHLTGQGLTNQPFNYHIFNITGKVVLSGKMLPEKHAVNIENLAPGNYFILLSKKNKRWSGRFIKYQMNK